MPVTTISRKPAAASDAASPAQPSSGSDRTRPRVYGMTQYEQKLSHPS